MSANKTLTAVELVSGKQKCLHSDPTPSTSPLVGVPYAEDSSRTLGVYDIHENTAPDDHTNLEEATYRLYPAKILPLRSISISSKSQLNSPRRLRN